MISRHLVVARSLSEIEQESVAPLARSDDRSGALALETTRAAPESQFGFELTPESRFEFELTPALPRPGRPERCPAAP